MKGGSSSTNSRTWEVEGLLLPGLDNGTALRCLAFVPVYLHPLLASLNRAYHSLILSATLLDLRRTLGLADHLLLLFKRVSYDLHGAKPSVRVLDLKCNTWMTLSLPAYIEFHNSVTFFCSGKRLLCSSPVFASIQYDFTANKWSQARLYASIQYDFTANKWSQAPPMLERTRSYCAFATNGDYCFVAGGTTGWYALKSAEMLDPIKNSWAPLPPMRVARPFCHGFFMDDKFYVVGGRDDVCLSDAEVYDPSSKAWSTIQSMLLEPSIEQSMAVVKNELYAVHYTQSNPALHVYQKLTNTWQCLGPVLDKHDEGNLYISDGGLVSIGSNKLLVVGEWWPKSEVGDKRTYILCWEPSLKATLCRFVIIYSGPIEDERHSRSGGDPVCHAVVI